MCIIILFICAVTITFTKELKNGFQVGLEINGGDLMRLIIVGMLAVSTGVCGVCSSYYNGQNDCA